MIFSNDKDEAEVGVKVDAELGHIMFGDNSKDDHGGLVGAVTDKMISVVTVVYNGVDTLEETILSIIQQDYDNIEYIIIDGGSSDGTVDIIKRYEQYIDYWVSEPDCGIYDAMNKGIQVLCGQWMMFMNSGDVYCASSIVRRLMDYVEEGGGDLYYGDHEVRYLNSKYVKTINAKNSSWLWMGMPFCHQSMLVKSVYHKNYRFNLNYKVAADYDFLCFLFVEKKAIFTKVPMSVSKVMAAGVSDMYRDATIKEQWQISQKYFPAKYGKFFFYLRRIDAFLRTKAKRFLSVLYLK